MYDYLFDLYILHSLAILCNIMDPQKQSLRAFTVKHFALVFFWATLSVHTVHAANFVTDSFTEASGTPLASHIGEVGATWTKHPLFASSTIVLDSNGQAGSGVNNFSIYYASGNPSSSDYSVSSDFKMYSDSGSFGVIGRTSTASTTYYLLDYEGGGAPIKLYTIYNGSATGTTATSSFTPVIGNTYRFELSMIGTTIRGYLDGVLIIQKTDALIAPAGKAGLFTNWGTFSPGGTRVGWVLDNFSANDEHGTIMNVTSNNLWENGYDGTGSPEQSPFSFLRIITDANILRIVGTTSLFSTQPSFASLGIRVDGVERNPMVFSSDGQSTSSISLPVGTKTVDITVGPQNRPGSIILGTFLRALELLGVTSYSIVNPITADRLLIYGDSISSGFTDTANKGQQSWVSLLRNAGRKTMIEAYGYRAVKDDAIDDPTRTAFISRIGTYAPNAIWLAIGTNDYGLNKWSAASFGTAYASLLDDLHTALPSSLIFCQTPLVRSSEGANGFGNTLTDYRSQITTVCAARPWATLIDGTAIIALSDLADGIHPSTAGHAKYENFVAPYVAINGGFAVSVSSSQAVAIPATATVTRALGSAFISGDSITINWGDGNNTNLNPSAGATTTSANHTYSAWGTYTISFTNNKNWGNAASTTYTALDVTPPLRSNGAPTGIILSTPQPRLFLTTDEVATCKYSNISGTTYSSMNALENTASTSHSTLLNVGAGESPTFYVKCQDSSLNVNPDDYSISFNVTIPPFGGGGFVTPFPSGPPSGFVPAVQTNSNGDITIGLGKINDDIITIIIATSSNFFHATTIKATSSLIWKNGKDKNLYIKYCTLYQCSNPTALLVDSATTSLQADVPPTPFPKNATPSSYVFTQNLALHDVGLDVLELQKYLNSHGFAISQYGNGSSGNETSYFELLTYVSLVKFQEAHSGEILTPRGLTKGTGFFGPVTRNFVNQSQ